MAFNIKESFEVQAPVQRVWDFLIDPARVALCLPGAELLESRDDGSYLGAVKVKVGPLAMAYKGTVKFTELDAASRVVRLAGEGREAGGAGSARLAMRSSLSQLETGSTRVVVEAEMELVGKIVQFGRGMIEEVSKQLFRQFSTCVKQRLEAADEPPTEKRGAPEASPAVGAKPVRALPLAARAIWSMVRRWLRSLLGRPDA